MGPGSSLAASHRPLEALDERLLLRQLPLAATLARHYAGRSYVEEQFIEAALVGLVRAVDSFEASAGHEAVAAEEFAPYAEKLIEDELQQFIEDCRLERADGILDREQAAVAASKRVEQALVQQDEVRRLAMSLGCQVNELASGFLSMIVRHPTLFAAMDIDLKVCLTDRP